MTSHTTVVLVTGCTKGGIGFSLCEAFAAQGCKVYASARRLESMQGFKYDTIERVKLDITSDEEVQQVINTIAKQQGHVDIVVNNAGVLCVSPLADVPMDQLREAFDANVFGAVRTAKAVIPHMAEQRSGTIVNIGSIVGETPTPWSGVYASTKASLLMISEVLEMECAPFGIRIMHVAPGGVRSNLSANNRSKFTLPEDSLYKGWLDSIIRRIYASQEPGTMDTDTFAKKIVSAALQKTPPRYLSIGTHTWLWALFRWLPRTWVLRILWNRVAGRPRE